MKTTMPREFYIPKNAAKIQHKTLPAVAYLYERNNRLCAMAFYGKSDKPAFRFSFADGVRRMRHVSEWFANMQSIAESKAKRQAERKSFAHTLKVGDVLSNSWGYDQTNVEFFQVTKLLGKSMVEIRELCQESQETGFMSGDCVPVVGKFSNREPMRRRVTVGNSVDIYQHGTFGYARPYERKEIAPGVFVGQPKHYTAYA